MASRDDIDLRTQILEHLLQRVRADRFPSATVLDMIQSLIHDDELDQYASILLAKVRDDTYPSMDLMRRLVLLCV
jgi:hypothetical protein